MRVLTVLVPTACVCRCLYSLLLANVTVYTAITEHSVRSASLCAASACKSLLRTVSPGSTWYIIRVPGTGMVLCRSLCLFGHVVIHRNTYTAPFPLLVATCNWEIGQQPGLPQRLSGEWLQKEAAGRHADDPLRVHNISGPLCARTPLCRTGLESKGGEGYDEAPQASKLP